MLFYASCTKLFKIFEVKAMYSLRKFYALLINDPHLLEVIGLTETIQRRYSRLNFNTGEFAGLANSEKLPILIKIINNDQDIATLSRIVPGGISRIYWIEGIYGIMGKDLRMEDKLYLCDFDIYPDLPFSPSMPGYYGYCNKIPVTATLVNESLPGLGYVELRNALLRSSRNAYNRYRAHCVHTKMLKSTY